MAKKNKKSGILGKLIFGVMFLIASYLVVEYYGKIFRSSVSIPSGETYFYVYSDWNRNDLVNALLSSGVLSDTTSFIWVADQKEFLTPKPGRYLLEDGMNNNELVNLLRSGAQEPVQLTFNSIRTKESLAARIGEQLEVDSLELIRAIENPTIVGKYGFNDDTFISLFIPNTYEFYWNTSAEEFIARMAKEYKRFWTADRIEKARKLNLSQSEVATLASIVQAEQSSRPDERPKVAGLYINRLRKRMKLQSDPTLIFALGDFSIKRVLNHHKAVASPYNTYLNSGLPPGPINLPERSSIDAVLNYESHDYIFMCAKADFSGYHHFARTNAQHNIYANQYRAELNRRRIMK